MSCIKIDQAMCLIDVKNGSNNKAPPLTRVGAHNFIYQYEWKLKNLELTTSPQPHQVTPEFATVHMVLFVRYYILENFFVHIQCIL